MDKILAKTIEAYKKGRNMENLYESKWLVNFLELVDFKENFGHLDFTHESREHKKLYVWVNRQRRNFMESTIDPEREKLLKLVGFEFKYSLRDDWNIMFNKLFKFKKKSGHVRITLSHKDQQLYYWLRTQRYCNWQGKLDNKKLQKLLDIGVVMDNKKTTTWATRLKELAKFKEKHDHMLVCATFTDNQQLLKFVHHTRENKQTLHTEKIKQLNDLGFVWKPGREAFKLVLTNKSNNTWLNHYQKLKAYKKKYGTCLVPYNDKRYSVLYNWSKIQKNGKNLSEEKRKLLEKIDFFNDFKNA